MNIIILADIHSNLEAWLETEKHLEKVDKTWCLGDIVGYGPNPNEVIDRVINLSDLVIAGNHDFGSTSKIDISLFSHIAHSACLWTQKKLTDSNISLINNLLEIINPIDEIILAHGSPRQPVWEYIFDVSTAKSNFLYFSEKIAFVAHTHIPAIFSVDEQNVVKRESLQYNHWIDLNIENKRYILNPGSIGQPRDGDPRLSFLIFNPAQMKVLFQRFEYNHSITQKKIIAAGLPVELSIRLENGS